MDDLSAYEIDLAYEQSFPTPYANSSLLVPLLLSLVSNPTTPRIKSTFRDIYDYIIVGGGAAGSTLANRLTEGGCASVLVLEAGPKIPLLTEVPGASAAYYNSRIDWQYYTTPQKHTGYGIVDNKLPFPAGKTLGGSTTINGMEYVRGNRRNFDDWERMGAKGWGYDKVLPYFKKTENNENLQYVDKGYHGHNGPVTVSIQSYSAEIKEPILDSAKEFGYKIRDINGHVQTGFSLPQSTIRRGQRCSAAKAYLVPASERPNLDILINAHVNKVVIEGAPPRARGVIFDHDNVTHTVQARREVILSAGAINSPQLLMLSGIGPRKELDKHNIRVVKDLPVGENLMEHCSASLSYTVGPNINLLSEKLADPQNIQQYIDTKTGPLTTAGVPAVVFSRGDKVRPKKDFPRYELYFLESEAGLFQYLCGLKKEVYEAYYKPHEGQSLLTCLSQLLQPRSRGTVTLNSADPYDPPLIDPNYLADDKDTRDIVAGLKLCQRLSRTEAWKRVNATPFPEQFPKCEGVAEDDAYFRCLARQFLFTQSHQAGTARMGDANDPAAVVDPRLRVKGVQNLRVVDASVMPVVVSGNTMTATYMIAEKASDLIREDHHGGTQACDGLPSPPPFTPHPHRQAHNATEYITFFKRLLKI